MNAAVILAAGSSQRMGKRGKKELLDLEGKPVIAHSVDSFLQTGLFELILLVCPAGEEQKIKDLLPDNKKISYTTGGKSRQESVCLGLNYLSRVLNPEAKVLIHDGARPWVTPDLISSVLDLLKEKQAVIPVEPSTSAMKLLDGRGKIITHLKREDTWAAQTPQGFYFSELLEAHNRVSESDKHYIDDSELWNDMVGPVWTVPGDPANKKITYRDDL